MSESPEEAAARKRRAARVLRNLTIDEVSSVNAGAGVGVKVVMLKADSKPEPRVTEFRNTTEDEMQTQVTDTAQATIAKSLSAVATKRMTPVEAIQVHKRLAMEQFGGVAKSEADALNRWYQTSDGKTALHGLVHIESVRAQTANACGDAYSVIEKANSDSDDDLASGAPDLPAKDGQNPYLAALHQMAADHIAEGRSPRFKNHADAHAYLTHKSSAGGMLSRHAVAWDQKRMAERQGRA
jgi:hypothetical protein